MAFVRSVRFASLLICAFVIRYFPAASAADPVPKTRAVPEVKVQALKPKGFRAWIEDAPGINMFVFQGNVNKPIKNNDAGTLIGEVTSATGGKWIYFEPDIELKIGDTINYYVLVTRDGTGHVLDNQSFIVKKFIPITVGHDRLPSCNLSATQVHGKAVCISEIIFEEEFLFLDEERWQIEQYIPMDNPEFPFMTYQRLAHNPTVLIDSGTLRISAKLQENMPGFNSGMIQRGPLNIFKGCTKPGEYCVKSVAGADIIPPVVTGRITLKALPFKYGTVYVRAKMPKGDWLYPEILLEPVGKKYGAANYHSGIIKIAVTRGNTLLYTNDTNYNNKVLYGGPIMDSKCYDTLLKRASNEDIDWADDFHLYAMTWGPDGITLRVDGEEWGRVDPGPIGLRNQFSRTCNLQRDLLSMGTNMAPFDEPFYLTLGLAVGGIKEFPDNSYTTADHPKPWKNGGRKAMMNFWQDTSWLSTWTQPELVIDSIKIVAL